MKSGYIRTLFAFLLLLPIWASADLLLGRVVGVADGDTVTVLDAAKVQYKIRLMGIDAPEKKMPYGQRAKEHLSTLVFGKQVRVEYHKQDKYGRIVGKVAVDGLDANLAQIKAGLAWHYKQYEREQSETDQQVYANAEAEARDERAGLWADPTPVPPWDWRKQQRRKD